jgi:hypothetical protein
MPSSQRPPLRSSQVTVSHLTVADVVLLDVAELFLSSRVENVELASLTVDIDRLSVRVLDGGIVLHTGVNSSCVKPTCTPTRTHLLNELVVDKAHNEGTLTNTTSSEDGDFVLRHLRPARMNAQKMNCDRCVFLPSFPNHVRFFCWCYLDPSKPWA